MARYSDPEVGSKAREALRQLEMAGVERVIESVTVDIQRLRSTGRISDSEIAATIAESENLPAATVLAALSSIEPPAPGEEHRYLLPRTALGRITRSGRGFAAGAHKTVVSADRIRETVEGIARDLRLKRIRLAEQPEVQEAIVERLPELAALPRHERHRKVLDAYLKRSGPMGAEVVTRDGKREIVFP